MLTKSPHHIVNVIADYIYPTDLNESDCYLCLIKFLFKNSPTIATNDLCDP